MTQPAPAPRFSRTTQAVDRPPAHDGQHTVEVLRDWGLDDARVDELVTLATQVRALPERSQQALDAGEHGFPERLLRVAEVVAAAELGHVAPVDGPQAALPEERVDLGEQPVDAPDAEGDFTQGGPEIGHLGHRSSEVGNAGVRDESDDELRVRLPEKFDDEESLSSKLATLAKWIKESKRTVVHTGAGVRVSISH